MVGCPRKSRRQRRTWRCRGIHAAQPKGADRLFDVLDALLAQILEGEAAHLAHMVAHAARDADAARHRQVFQPRSDVNAVAEDVAVLDHDVADIDADTKLQAMLVRQVLVCRGQRVLDLHRAVDSFDDAGELRQHAVAGRAGDTAIVGIDEIIDDHAVGGQGGQRCRFVALHVAAVALDVGGEDGDQLAFQAGRFHASAPSPSGW